MTDLGYVLVVVVVVMLVMGVIVLYAVVIAEVKLVYSSRSYSILPRKVLSRPQ